MKSSVAKTSRRLAWHGRNRILNSFWQQFESEYKTEEDCINEIYERADTLGLVACKHCRGMELERVSGSSRLMLCVSCHKYTSFTTGTIFERVRRIRPYFAAIWLSEQGISWSSNQLHQLAAIAIATAQKIFKKITSVITNLMHNDSQDVSSALFLSLVCKRSRLTPALQHPCAEQLGLESGTADSAEKYQELAATNIPNEAEREPIISPVEKAENSTDMPASEAKILSLVSGQPISFESLCERSGMPTHAVSSSVSFLEIFGLVNRLPGDKFVRPFPERPSQKKTSVDDAPMNVIAAFLAHARSVFHGISRKYLQNYLAAYWCHVDRERWTRGTLLEACLQSPFITNETILAYVTPLYVKLRTS